MGSDGSDDGMATGCSGWTLLTLRMEPGMERGWAADGTDGAKVGRAPVRQRGL